MTLIRYSPYKTKGSQFEQLPENLSGVRSTHTTG